MTLSLYYPVKPFGINQYFGANAEYYLSKFGDKGHQGLDLFAPHATPLYAPCDGDAFYKYDAHGGAGIYIRVPNNATPQYNVILWHLCTKDDKLYSPNIPTDGSSEFVKTGDLIGYTDNSGAPFESSGDHLHVGVIPCDNTGAPLYPNNGFHGCVNPLPYFNGQFAQDIQIKQQIVERSAEVVNIVSQSNLPSADKLKWYIKVGQFLKNLLQ
jgi:murein DD-endopeptidase MepM/ murein hydrolase activator NlpD